MVVGTAHPTGLILDWQTANVAASSEDSFPMPASSSPAATPSSELPPARRSIAPWLIFLVLVLVPIVGISAFFGRRQLRLRAAIADQGEIATVLDSFITRLEAGDAEGAEQFTTMRGFGNQAARRQITEARLAKPHLYRNYKSLEVSDVQVKYERGFWSIRPEINYIEARVSGAVEYENGTRETFTSGLDRHEDTWLVSGLKIEETLAKAKGADK